MAKLNEIKRGTNWVLYNDGTNDLIRIQGVRLSFPKIAYPEPETDDDNKPRIDPKTGKHKSSFSGVFMVPKDTHQDVLKICVELINKLQKANDAKVSTDKKFIRDGDDLTREEYEGHYIITARESKRPPVRDRRGELIVEPEKIEQIFEAGVLVNVLIRPWFFNGKARGSNKDHPKRISAGLMGVQFHSDDGTRFSSGSVDESDAWDVDDSAPAGTDLDDDDDGL